MIRMLMVCIGLILLLAAVGHAVEPVAWIELGKINVEHGLSLLDGGDGPNEPAIIGGSECRRNILEGNLPSYYLYFDYYAAGRLRRPMYVTVEYFDDGFGHFRIQYDSADLNAPERGAYKDGTAELLLDSREWRTVIFELTDARFEGRQTLEADFSLVSSRPLALRKVTIETIECPAYSRQPQAQRQRIARCVGRLSPSKGFQIVFGGVNLSRTNDLHQSLANVRLLAPVIKALGATSVESRVTWASVEKQPGRWDWDMYDTLLSILKENGLKWTPLIVIGPADTIPDWFYSSSQSVKARSLSNGIESRAQSVWNPHLETAVEHFADEFAKHYQWEEAVESIVVAIGGEYPDGMSSIMNITSPLGTHTQPGYWCGDDYARADFRKYLESRYQSIAALNEAWRSDYSGFDRIEPFIPDDSHPVRARLDMLTWYHTSISRLSIHCLSFLRKWFLETSLYASIDGSSVAAVDQCKAAAKLNAGVRLANEASDYGHNFTLTRLAASAANHYGGYCSFGSGGLVTTDGITSRLFNSSASGIKGIHVYHPTVLIQAGGITAWRDAYDCLNTRLTNRPPIAVLVPQTTLVFDSNKFFQKVALLRDALDFDLVDETMIRDGALKRYKVLMILNGATLKEDNLDSIVDWVASGGMAVGCPINDKSDAEAVPSQFAGLFDESSNQQVAVKLIGSGLSVFVNGHPEQDSDWVEAIARAMDSLSNRAHANLVPDGLVDGVYTTSIGSSLLILNTTDIEIKRDMQIGVGRRQNAVLPAGKIIKLNE